MKLLVVTFLLSSFSAMAAPWGPWGAVGSCRHDSQTGGCSQLYVRFQGGDSNATSQSKHEACTCPAAFKVDKNVSKRSK